MISDRDLIDHLKLSLPSDVTDEEVKKMWKMMLWGEERKPEASVPDQDSTDEESDGRV